MMKVQDDGSKWSAVGNDDAIPASYGVITSLDLRSVLDSLGRIWTVQNYIHSHALNILDFKEIRPSSPRPQTIYKITVHGVKPRKTTTLQF